MICDYVNTQAGKTGPEVPPNVGPNMITVSPVFYDRLGLPGGHILSAIDLADRDIRVAQFLQLQYFFLPVIPRHHSSLVVISPINRTVELLDSYSAYMQPAQWQQRVEITFTWVFHFLEYIL
jgi:hypothetical protein